MRLFSFIFLINILCSNWNSYQLTNFWMRLNKWCFVVSENKDLFWNFVCDIASQNILFCASLFQLKWFAGNNDVVSTGFSFVVYTIYHCWKISRGLSGRSLSWLRGVVNRTVANPDLELREAGTVVLPSLPAFLLSVIFSFFFTQNKGGGDGPPIPLL